MWVGRSRSVASGDMANHPGLDPQPHRFDSCAVVHGRESPFPGHPGVPEVSCLALTDPAFLALAAPESVVPKVSSRTVRRTGSARPGSLPNIRLCPGRIHPGNPSSRLGPEDFRGPWRSRSVEYLYSASTRVSANPRSHGFLSRAALGRRHIQNAYPHFHRPTIDTSRTTLDTSGTPARSFRNDRLNLSGTLSRHIRDKHLRVAPHSFRLFEPENSLNFF
jgi:hypothetical protein